jgi:HK97 family phage major capsid protein
MDETLKKELMDAVDVSIKTNIEAIAGPAVAEAIEKKVKETRLAEALNGKTFLDNAVKLEFAQQIMAIASGEKAAYLGSSDQAGGYLLPAEVSAEIIRIAATTGIIMRDAQKWPMNADTLEIPRYTGSVMDFTYQGEDTEGDETQKDLGEAVLNVKYAQMIIRAGNRFLKNASVNMADWFLAMAGEALAYRIDKEGFMGGTFPGSPFVGLLGSSEVTVQTMASGKTGFDKFDFAEATDAVAAIPTAAVQGGAFYFHRSVWAKLKAKKDATSGQYEFNQLNTALMSFLKENGIQPVGMIDNYPVFTSDVLPKFSDSAISTKFGVFANMKLALAIGDKGPMEVAKSTDATVGGKSMFRANQTAFRFSHEHALSVALPAAAVVFKTAAS